MSREIREGSLKDTSLQFFHLAILDSATTKSRQVDIGKREIKIFARQILRRVWRQVDRCRLNRHRADRVVWTVVGPGFIDGQELYKLESNPRCPVDELPQRADVADP